MHNACVGTNPAQALTQSRWACLGRHGKHSEILAYSRLVAMGLREHNYTYAIVVSFMQGPGVSSYAVHTIAWDFP